MKSKIKLSIVLLSLLLVISLFAISVIAQEDEIVNGDEIEVFDEEEIIESTDMISSDEVEVLEEEDTEEKLPEVEEEINEIENSGEVQDIEKKAIFTITQVTIGEGFVMKSDKSDAELFRGIWVVKRFINKTTNLEDIENKQIESKKFGFVIIGIAEKKEKFKIEMKDFSEENVKFDLKDNAGTVVGSMEIKPKKYARITLWFGTLILNSGKYVGTWDVTAISKTKIIKPKIRKPPVWNIFAFKQRSEAAIKERVQEKIFEREGLGEFIKENREKNLEKLSESKRTAVINKKERFEKRIEARVAARARRAGLQ